MNRQLTTWKFILENLENSIPVILLYVLESRGSSPGRQGFFMAVNEKKEMKGSIGGGIMEHKFVEMAWERLKSGKQILRFAQDDKAESGGELRKQVHDKTASKDQSGMICSGEQTILLYQVLQKDIDHIKDLVQSLEINRNGALHLSPRGIIYNETIPSKNYDYVIESEDRWSYMEKTGYKYNLYIIGGGHCSLALSAIMGTMDFYIRLYEERTGLNTIAANEYVHEKIFVNDYSELKTMIPSGGNNFVVVMSFGYRTDDTAVRALLGKDLRYFGLLGSKKKIEKMFSDYRNEGIDQAILDKIHSPIGIQIKSETPQEIAVSIAAEIIKVKNS